METNNIAEKQFIEVKRNYLSAAIQCKCPRCRQGDIFIEKNPFKLSNSLKMPKDCPVCGQPMEIEVGFYTGAAYTAYAITVALMVAVFVAWKVLIGMTLAIGDNRIFECLGVAILILIITMPWIMRFSRSLWLSFFVGYDKDWRINKPTDTGRSNPKGMEHQH
ncbi:DUF983 domain-containing protein [Rhizosphaericola mali]|uniref:DUF983 domain-containing protein n=1 Tax=Rhizosphaericola mali TaxID=2545455 RepID=A0A5P2G664_9BACT|nr:DUF983 domain-containing protein [Rhizosphaericola mali]QES89392.1 DUF983 domain-containing protein [Rhizosphaericola mali]